MMAIMMGGPLDACWPFYAAVRFMLARGRLFPLFSACHVARPTEWQVPLL